MKKRLRLLIALLVMAALIALVPVVRKLYPVVVGSSADLAEVRQRVEATLTAQLDPIGLELGAPAFIRIFKEESELEVWLQQGERFQLFKTYDICNFSGELGPKLKEGDRQSPEGFYSVGRSAMNPNSNYHLSFNLGFPNAYDQLHQRTGSFLMVHGKCVSIGCYAMTDAGIEEIYLIVEAALSNGESDVPVHAFPFRMTSERLSKEQDNAWFGYWANLKAGYDLFEVERVPPIVSVVGRQYEFVSGI